MQILVKYVTNREMIPKHHIHKSTTPNPTDSELSNTGMSSWTLKASGFEDYTSLPWGHYSNGWFSSLWKFFLLCLVRIFPEVTCTHYPTSSPCKKGVSTFFVPVPFKYWKMAKSALSLLFSKLDKPNSLSLPHGYKTNLQVSLKLIPTTVT